MIKLSISTGKKITPHVKNIEITFDELIDLFKKYTQIIKPKEHYSKEAIKREKLSTYYFCQSQFKDNYRKNSNALQRHLIALDIDKASNTLIDNIKNKLKQYSYIYHYTFSSTKEDKRIRLVLPLSKAIDNNEYLTIHKFIRELIGTKADKIDDCKDLSRAFFLPKFFSDSHDQKIYSNKNQYIDLMYKREIDKREEKQGYYYEKIPQSFNNTYRISQVLDGYLNHVYTREKKDRYKLIGADSTAGLVIYDNDTLAKSFHTSDIAHQSAILTPFDLLKFHLFNNDIRNTIDFCKLELKNKGIISITPPVSSIIKPPISLDKEISEGKIEAMSLENRKLLAKIPKGERTRKIKFIFENDNNLNNLFAFDEFSNLIIVIKKSQIVKDADVGEGIKDIHEILVRQYIAISYSFEINRKDIHDEVINQSQTNKINTLQNHINELPKWDKIQRASTLFLDFLGDNEEDREYIKQTTIKMLKGAIQRALYPASKYDRCSILIGVEGIGKTSLLKWLGSTKEVKPRWPDGRLYTGSFYSIGDNDDIRKANNFWIVEVKELEAFKGKSNELIKAFLDETTDTLVPKFSNYTENYRRQCVFFGTSNRTDILKSTTGNRRFNPMLFSGPTKLCCKELCRCPKKHIDIDYVKQVWAEVLHIFMQDPNTEIDDEFSQKVLEMHEKTSIHKDTKVDYKAVIIDIYRKDLAEGTKEHLFVSMPDILSYVFQDNLARLSNWKKAEIKDIILSISFVKKYKRSSVGKRQYGFSLHKSIEKYL